MLQRYSQVGEHYIMRVPDGVKDGTEGAADILIYDEERDVHVKITFEAALKATGLFTDAGDLKDAKLANTEMEGGLKLSEYVAGVKKILAKTYSDEAKKVAICIARPFIEHAMLSAILTVSGQDTGATIFGPSDMQISANTSVKVIEGAPCLLSNALLHTCCLFNICSLCSKRCALLRPLHGPLQVGDH